MNLRQASVTSLFAILFFLGACASTKPDLPDASSADLDFPRKKEGRGGEGSEHQTERSVPPENIHSAEPRPLDLTGTTAPLESEPSPTEEGQSSAAPEPTEESSAPLVAEPSKLGSHHSKEAEISPSPPNAPTPGSSPAVNDPPNDPYPASSPPPPPTEEAEPPANVPPAANETSQAETSLSESPNPPSTSGESKAVPSPNLLNLSEPNSAKPNKFGSAIGVTEPPTSSPPDAPPPNLLYSSEPGSTPTTATGETSPSLGLNEPSVTSEPGITPPPNKLHSSKPGYAPPPVTGETSPNIGFTTPETKLLPPESPIGLSLGFSDPEPGGNSPASGDPGPRLGFSEPTPHTAEPTRQEPRRFLSLRELLNRRNSEKNNTPRSHIGWSDPEEPRLQSYLDDGPVLAAGPAAPRAYEAISKILIPREGAPALSPTAAAYDYEAVREALQRSSPRHPLATEHSSDALPLDYQAALQWLDKRNNIAPSREANPKPQRSYQAALRWLRNKGRD